MNGHRVAVSSNSESRCRNEARPGAGDTQEAKTPLSAAICHTSSSLDFHVRSAFALLLFSDHIIYVADFYEFVFLDECCVALPAK